MHGVTLFPIRTPPPTSPEKITNVEGGPKRGPLWIRPIKISQMLKRISPFWEKKHGKCCFWKPKGEYLAHTRPFSSSTGSAAAVGEDRHFESRESRRAAKHICLGSFSKTYLHLHGSTSDLICERTFPESCQERETLRWREHEGEISSNPGFVDRISLFS